MDFSNKIFRFVISRDGGKPGAQNEAVADGTGPGYSKHVWCEEPFRELTFGSRASGSPTPLFPILAMTAYLIYEGRLLVWCEWLLFHTHMLLYS